MAEHGPRATWRLVADIGGTNVRFAQAGEDGTPAQIRSYRVASYDAFGPALDAYLAECQGGRCVGAAIGAAGPVEDGSVKLTNAPWTLAESDISRQLGGARVRIVNDLEAVAHALPHLGPGDLEAVGPVLSPDPRRPMIAVNVGTGFGAASVARTAYGWTARASEAGHMSLYPASEKERAALDGIETVEEILSGRGVAALYARLFGDGASLAAEAVMANAKLDPVAARAVAIVGTVLGRVAGDLVLATGAWGGCLLCGSVATGWAAAGDRAAFRAAFEHKGPMAGRMAGVYSGIIRHGNVALLGLARMPLD